MHPSTPPPSSNPSNPPPVRPADLANVSLTELLDAYHSHQAPLVRARHGIGEPAPVGRLRGHALDELACGQAVADRVLAGRWVTVADALRYAAPIAHVAAAMGLEPVEVVAGLRSWADGQLQLHRDTGGQLGISPAEHDEVLALVEAGR